MLITNTINKQIFDFTCPGEIIARQLQQQIIPNTTHILDDIINQILTEEFDKEEHLLIDKIEIDLGDIAIEDFGNDEMLQNFKGALKQQISLLNNKQNITENDEILSFSEAELQMMIAFLSSGNFPWWADKTAQVNIDKMLKKLVREKPKAIKSFLLKQNSGLVADRLAKQFKPSARLAIDALVPGFINRSVMKPTSAEEEYEIDINEFSLKILEKLASIISKKGIWWGEEYKMPRLVKLLKESSYKWIKVLQSFNVLSEVELEKIKLFYSRKNRNKRTEAIKILNNLSVFQVEFLLQTASGFYNGKEPEYKNATFESDFPEGGFLNKASTSISENIFSRENINLNTTKKISGAAQSLHQSKEQNEVDDIKNLQDKEDFKIKLSDNKNQEDKNADFAKEIFVNESSAENATAGNSVIEKSVSHNVAAPTSNSFYESDKNQEKFVNNNNADQFSILKNKQETDNYDEETFDNSELSNTNKFSYNNQNEEKSGKIITSENGRENININDAKNLDYNLVSNINNSSKSDEIQSNSKDIFSTENERESTNIDDVKNFGQNLFSNTNSLLESNRTQSNTSNIISIQNERQNTNIIDVKNLEQSLFSNKNSSIENNKIQPVRSNEISAENEREEINNSDAKNLQQGFSNTNSSLENERQQNKIGDLKDLQHSNKNISEGGKDEQNQDKKIFNEISVIKSSIEEKNQQTNEKGAFFHSDNNLQTHADSNKNKQNENKEVSNSSKDFNQINNDKTERVISDTNLPNSFNNDFLFEEKASGKVTKQNEANREENKQFEYKNSEIQQNYRDELNEEFVAGNDLELKNIGERNNDYDYNKKSRISYIWNKLGLSNQPLFIELSLLKEKNLLKLETRFKQFDRALHEQKRLLNIIIEHPYLFAYDLLQILTGLYLIEAAPSDSTKEFIEKSKMETPSLSVLSDRISSSGQKFFHVISNLTASEETVLQDVLKKKSYETDSEKKIIKKVFKKLPEESIYLLHFFTKLPEDEVQQLFSSLRKDTRRSNQEKPHSFNLNHLKDERQKIHIENAGLCIIAAYFPLLFNNLQYLEKGIFKNKAIAARALFLTEYIASGKLKNPEYLLPFNKLLCGFEMEESIPASIRLTKKEKMEAEDLLGSVIENWETIKNTSRKGFRESFLQRRGILTENELTWTLQIEAKSYDMLLSTITWGFGIIKLPWMKKHIQVEWQNAR